MQSQPEETPGNSPDLQFETVEGARSQGVSCSVCQAALTTEYHELNGQPACAVCRARAEAGRDKDRGWNMFLLAALYGFGAAIAGGFLYWGFVKVTNFELGLMAIAVGWLVGKAVMKGSNSRGGRRYQWLAVALTYFSITISYGALIVEAMMKQPAEATQPDKSAVLQGGGGGGAAQPPKPIETPRPPAPANAGPVTAGQAAIGLGFFFLLILASPFLTGFSNVIGWVIIAIGLWEAWKHTAEVPFITGGPYPLGNLSAPPASTPPPPEASPA